MITINGKQYEVLNETIQVKDLMLINNPYPHSTLKNVIKECFHKMVIDNEEHYSFFIIPNSESKNGFNSSYYPKRMCKKVIEVL